eukprot:4310102-Prymnesium_polylepis.1
MGSCWSNSHDDDKQVLCRIGEGITGVSKARAARTAARHGSLEDWARRKTISTWRSVFGQPPFLQFEKLSENAHGFFAIVDTFD